VRRVPASEGANLWVGGACSPGETKQDDLGQYVVADYCYQTNILKNLRYYGVFIVQLSSGHCRRPFFSCTGERV
jgi:hypothetical protein